MNSVTIDNNSYFSDNYIEFERINILFGDNGTYRENFICKIMNELDTDNTQDNSIDVSGDYLDYRENDFDSDLSGNGIDAETLELFKKLFPKYKDIEYFWLDKEIYKLVSIIDFFNEINSPYIFLKNFTTRISYLNMNTIMEQMIKWVYTDNQRKIFVDTCDPYFIDNVNLNEILLFVRNDENGKIDIGKLSDSELVKCQAGIFTPGEIVSGEDHRRIMDDIIGKEDIDLDNIIKKPDLK